MHINHKSGAIWISGALILLGFLVFYLFYSSPEGKAAGDNAMPWLGIDVKILEAVTNNTRTDQGIIVANVFKASPAELSGIEKGDIVTTFDNIRINDAKTLKRAVADSQTGRVVRIGVLRDGAKRVFYPKLSKRPSNHLQLLAGTVDSKKLAWGIIVSSPSNAHRTAYNIPSSQKGVIVAAVFPGSQAAKLGVMPGDLIVSVNREKTDTILKFYDAISQNGVNQVVTWRENKTSSYIFRVDPNNPPLASMGTLIADTVARRVAITAMEPELDSPLAFRFAAAPYFIMVDTKSDRVTVLESPLASQDKARGGQVAQLLINNGAGAVITGSIGSTAFQYFSSMGIPVYTGNAGIAGDMLAKYKQGELVPATEETLLSRRNLLLRSANVQNVAGSSFSNRANLCTCTACGLVMSHPVGTSCAQLECPNCGSRLTRADAAVSNLNQPETIPGFAPQGTGVAGTAVAGSSSDSSGSGSGTGQQLGSVGGSLGLSYTIIGGTNNIFNAPMSPPSVGSNGQSSGSLGGGQNVAGSASSNQTEICVCPKCGLTLTHTLGTPCTSMRCPECGSYMISANAILRAAGMPETIPPSDTESSDSAPDFSGPPAVIPPYGQPPDVGSAPDSVGGAPSDAGSAQTIAGGTPTDTGPSDGTQINRPPGPDDTAASSDLSGARAAENLPQQPNSTNSGPGSGEGDGYPPNRPYTVPGQQTAQVAGVPVANDPLDLSYSPISKDKEKVGKQTSQVAGIPVANDPLDLSYSLSKEKEKVGKLNTYAVALEGPTVDSNVAQDFSNAPYFLIVPPQGNAIIIPNPNSGDLIDNDRQTAQFVVDEGATIVVAGTITDIAVDTLNSLRARSIEGITGIAKQLFYGDASSSLNDSQSHTGTSRPGISSSAAGSSDDDSEREGGPPPGRGGGKQKGKGEEDSEEVL